MKDYYVILQISRDAGLDDIRKAHRRLVTRYHPDRSEEPDPEKFREVQEAYEVLRDADRRKLYNNKLRSYEKRRAERHSYREPIRLWQDFETIFPSIDEILDHVRRNFFGPLRKVEPLRDMSLEVILNTEEAFHGVTFPLEVPLYQPCSRCGGRGGTFPFACLKCDGQGWELTKGRVTVTIPSGVQDGTVIRYPLQSLGIHNLWLILSIRIHP